MSLEFSLRNINGHAAAVVPILRLWLTVETEKLTYKLKPSKQKSCEYKSTL